MILGTKILKTTVKPSDKEITPLFYSILQASESLFNDCNGQDSDIIEYEIHIKVNRGDQNGKGSSN